MAISLFSCSDDSVDNVFDQAPANRLEQANSELLEALLAQTNGFKGVYFTKNDEFGGFTFFMKFNADGTVSMTSDFDADTEIQSSTYEVRTGTASELVFTTHNHIQKVSDPDYPGLRGTGFKGTSVFQLFSNENGTLTFRDVRNKNTGFFVLEPSGFSNFETESVASAEKSLAQRDNIIPGADDSIFQVLKIENSNGEYNFNFNYNVFSQFASPRVEIYEGSIPTIREFNFGVAFTEDGLIISPALEFEGVVYENFIYDEDTNSYISTVNGTTATILFDSEPAFLSSDVNELGKPGHATFGYRITWGASPLTSVGFNTLLDDTDQRIQADFGSSSYFYQVYYFAQPDADGIVEIRTYFVVGGALYYASYLFEQKIENNRLYLEYLGYGNGNASYFANASELIINFFASETGMYFYDHGSFSTDTSSYGNLSSSFTSADQPNLRLYGLWFD